jgi:hypothetical protein
MKIPPNTITRSQKLELTIYDSADSNMSATTSPKSRESSVSETVQLSHQLQADCASKAGNDGSQPPLTEPSLDAILSTFFFKISDRHRKLPQVFDKQGRLVKTCQHLKPTLEAARTEYTRQAAAVKQQARSLKGDPTGFNAPTSQSIIAAVIQTIIKKFQTPSQPEDSNIPSSRRLNHPVVLVDNSPGNHPGSRATAASLVHSSGSLVPVGTFSLSSKSNSSSFKTYGGRNQITKSHPKNAQNGADLDHSKRALRSGSPARVSERQQIFHTLPIVNVTSKQTSNQQLLPAARRKTSPPSNTSSSTLHGDCDRSHATNTVFVDGENQRHTPAPAKSFRAESRIPTPSARIEVAAPQFVHDQQPMVKHSKLCRTCGSKSCSCTLTQLSPEGILCSNNDCFREWWGVEDLQKHCGIKLCDAQEIKRKYNCWQCPPCLSKSPVFTSVPESSCFSPAPKPTLDIPEKRIDPIPENGTWPEDADIREPLQALTGILQQYTGTSTMSRNQLSQINPQTRILDIPCIRDEILQVAGTAQKVVGVIRELLDVPEGVLIREKVAEAKLQDTTCSICIRSILSFLITNFVFHSGSPFEEGKLWSKTMTDCKHPCHLAQEA